MAPNPEKIESRAATKNTILNYRKNKDLYLEQENLNNSAI